MATRILSDAKDDRAAAWLVARVALILFAGFFAFFPALRGGWLWDDDILITQNAVVQSSTGLWKIWFQPTSMVDYFPLKVTVEWIEWHLFGNNTFGYHLVSLALHLTGALLLWRLFAKLGLGWGWLGGLLFAVHPLTVESVAWIAELKNTLSLPLFLAAMLCWIDFDERRRASDYWLSFAFFLAAMLCKTTMVAFPFVILLFASWKRDRITWPDLKASAPFFIVSLALGAITLLFLSHQSAYGEAQLGGPLSRIACAGLAIAFYLSKCLRPLDLMPIYPRWNIDPPTAIQFLPWLIVIIAIAGMWFARRTWGRHALLGFGFFLLMLLPFAGFVGGSYMRFSWVMDHIAYLPLIGIIGLFIAALEALTIKAPVEIRAVVLGIYALLIAAAMIGSHRYAAIFTDAYTYWNYAAQKNPDAWPAHNNLGNALEAEGRSAAAMEQFDLALQGNPTYYEALLNRGQLKLLRGDTSGAIVDLNQAVAADPNGAQVYFTRSVYDQVIGDYSAALYDLRRFRLLAPGDKNADYAALWLWIIRTWQDDKGNQELSDSTRWNAGPADWPTQNRRYLLGQIPEGDYLSSAVISDTSVDQGQHCEAWYYVGMKRLLSGDKAGASEAFRAAILTGKTDYFEYTLARAQLGDVLLRK